MAIWSGFEPYESEGPSIADWATIGPILDSDGERVRWWEGPTCGLEFHPNNCTGFGVEPFVCSCEPDCDCTCSPTELEGDDLPCHINFSPFWTCKSTLTCELRDVGEIEARLRSEAANGRMHAVAAHFWGSLATTMYPADGDCDAELEPAVTVLSPDPVSPGVGVGMLVHARANLGSGVFVAPGYAQAALNPYCKMDAQGRPTLWGRPLILDDSFGAEGPGGPVASADQAWVYHIAQPPVIDFAFVQLTRIGKQASCMTCCDFLRWRELAITAFNPCGAFAALIDIKDC